MRLLSLYLRQSWAALLTAVVLGVVSGLSTAALLAVINHVLKSDGWSGIVLATFVGLCVFRPIVGVGAHPR